MVLIYQLSSGLLYKKYKVRNYTQAAFISINHINLYFFVFHVELQFELMMNGDDEQIKRVKEIMDR